MDQREISRARLCASPASSSDPRAQSADIFSLAEREAPSRCRSPGLSDRRGTEETLALSHTHFFTRAATEGRVATPDFSSSSLAPWIVVGDEKSREKERERENTRFAGLDCRREGRTRYGRKVDNKKERKKKKKRKIISTLFARHPDRNVACARDSQSPTEELANSVCVVTRLKHKRTERESKRENSIDRRV